jgi:hypothetical protein
MSTVADLLEEARALSESGKKGKGYYRLQKRTERDPEVLDTKIDKAYDVQAYYRKSLNQPGASYVLKGDDDRKTILKRSLSNLQRLRQLHFRKAAAHPEGSEERKRHLQQANQVKHAYKDTLNRIG